ncbi:MAG: hypothetical protein HOI21_07810 [Bacteroidetes Order II. Incertae sedis bacterium]|jgi:hypothetical protein|nr:hypothetical protein [Bacteroidetes Order II. bacterium]
MIPIYYIGFVIGLMVLGLVIWIIWRIRSAFDRNTDYTDTDEGFIQLACFELGVGGLGYWGWDQFFT